MSDIDDVMVAIDRLKAERRSLWANAMHIDMPLDTTFRAEPFAPITIRGFVYQPNAYRIVAGIDYAYRTNRKAKRARCKARRRDRLPRRHWVARARRGDR